MSLNVCVKMVDLRNQLFMVSVSNVVSLVDDNSRWTLFISSNVLVGFGSSAVILLVPATGNNTGPV